MFKQYLRYDKEDSYYYDLDEFAYWGRWHRLNLFILKYFSNREDYPKEYIDSGCCIFIDETAIDAIIKMFNEGKLNSEYDSYSHNNEYNKQILNGIKELIQESYYIYYYASW